MDDLKEWNMWQQLVDFRPRERNMATEEEGEIAITDCANQCCVTHVSIITDTYTRKNDLMNVSMLHLPNGY